jgi:transmembrane sensor
MDDRKPNWFDEHLEEGVEPAVREAITWFNLLRSDAVAKEDRVAFRAWLRRDPAHADAFRQVEALWNGLSGLPEARRRRRSVTRRNFGKGALVLALAGSTWWASRYHPFADYRTGTGERRTVTLPDGSRVDLATSTALSIDFGPDARRLTLHEGEAFFDVSPDAARPFVVETGRGRVTALGTAFALSDEGDRVVVTVTHHAVQVDAAARSLRVEAGLQAAFDSGGIGVPAAVDEADVLAWREGRLIFVNARLDRVVGALNRWRSGRIVILNETLAAHPVTLIVNLEDIDEALHQLEDALPLTLTNVTPLLTLVHAR